MAFDRKHGAEVSIISPKGKGYEKWYEQIEGINIYRHPLWTEGKGPLGYIVEYTVALFWEFLLSLKILFIHGFDAIHACNPPDLIFMVAAPFKIVGKKFIFDHLTFIILNHSIPVLLITATFFREMYV